MPLTEILKVTLLGLIEGITEWLPVSSTGHILLFDLFFPLNARDEFISVFEYVIQLAAILAVVILFFRKIFPLSVQKQEDKKKLVWKNDSLTLWLKIILACIPAVLAVGIDAFFENRSETVKAVLIATMLILYGILFIVIENHNRGKEPVINDVSELSYRTAFLIGCCQLLAAVPGTSRSGVTILGALLLGVSRTTAAEFTFFLAIPTMVGSSAYKLLVFFLNGNTFTATEIGYLCIGCAVAFATSLLCIRLLMNFVKKHDFKPFGIYRIILGIVVLSALVIPYL